MSDTATHLRNAVLGVLLDNGGVNGLTAEDYAFLNLCSTYGQTRDGGGNLGDLTDKYRADLSVRPQTPADDGGRAARLSDPADGPLPTTLPTMPPAALDARTAAPLVATRPTPTFPGMPAPGSAAPDRSEEQEALPLGTADRGPEPQELPSLLSTDPADPPIDPTDPPFDYSRLPSHKPAGTIA